MSLEQEDAKAAAVAVAPRVTLESMKAKIAAQYTFTADKALAGCPIMDECKLLTICVLVLKNGFALIGKSAPASPANFNAELGAEIAYEDALRQIWPLEGYALREQLSAKE